MAQIVKNPTANVGDARDTGSILGRDNPWRREWQSTPAFLPGEFHGQRSLVGYSPLSHKEWDTTERLTLSLYNLEHARLFKDNTSQELMSLQAHFSYLMKRYRSLNHVKRF